MMGLHESVTRLACEIGDALDLLEEAEEIIQFLVAWMEGDYRASHLSADEVDRKVAKAKQWLKDCEDF